MKRQSSSFLRTGTGDLENCPCEKYRLGTNGLIKVQEKWNCVRVTHNVINFINTDNLHVLYIYCTYLYVFIFSFTTSSSKGKTNVQVL
jgi:hypothetical protein